MGAYKTVPNFSGYSALEDHGSASGYNVNNSWEVSGDKASIVRGKGPHPLQVNVWVAPGVHATATEKDLTRYGNIRHLWKFRVARASRSRWITGE